jgi:hypothetical protein
MEITVQVLEAGARLVRAGPAEGLSLASGQHIEAADATA